MDVGDGMWLAAVWLVVDVEDGTTTGLDNGSGWLDDVWVEIETDDLDWTG